MKNGWFCLQTSAVYVIISTYMRSRNVDEVKLAEMEPIVRAKGYTDEHFKDCLQEYAEINVWHESRGKLKLVDTDQDF